MMRAYITDRYGSPDVLKVTEISKPVPAKDEVLIKVYATSMNAADWHVLRADPWPVRLAFGLLRPALPVLGFDCAGVVEAVGKDVKQFKSGDEVYGDLR
jgi:NADPH:quinone reductase-like Zn-dependent oxidoreductase